MLKSFRRISILEGISFLSLFFISMPLKYIWEIGGPNKVIGYIHGGLFMLYIVMAIMIKPERNWDNKTLGIVLLCSVIPFGTFWMDRKYLREA